MLLVGSRAIKQHFNDFPREPKDWDYVAFPPYTFESNTKKVKDTEFLKNAILVERYSEKDEIVSANDLYTLKLSHIFWPIALDKHLFDIQFLKKKGCVADMELFERLYAYWSSMHGQNKRIDFDKKNEEFFQDKVHRQYPHDELHNIINPSPLYKFVKPDLEAADISQELFNNLDRKQQLELIREEAYVLALERYMIPNSGTHWRVAYSKMLKALMQRLTPLWLGVFIAENYIDLQQPTFNYYEKFQNHNKQ